MLFSHAMPCFSAVSHGVVQIAIMRCTILPSCIEHLFSVCDELVHVSSRNLVLSSASMFASIRAAFLSLASIVLVSSRAAHVKHFTISVWLLVESFPGSSSSDLCRRTIAPVWVRPVGVSMRV